MAASKYMTQCCSPQSPFCALDPPERAHLPVVVTRLCIALLPSFLSFLSVCPSLPPSPLPLRFSSNFVFLFTDRMQRCLGVLT